MLPESIAVTLKVVEALDRIGVRYFIGGSSASAVYGVARSTIDADLVADLRPEHAQPLFQALAGDFYADLGAIRKAIERKRSFNVIHLQTMFKVDVFVLKDRPFDHAQFARRVKLSIATDPGCEAYVATAEDTILAKLEWYRLGKEVSERQWRDVVGVLVKQGKTLDIAYLRHWAAALEVSGLLNKALKEARSARNK